MSILKMHTSAIAIAVLLSSGIFSTTTIAQEESPDTAEQEDAIIEEESCLGEGVAFSLLEEERQLLNERRERLEQEEARLSVARTRIETDIEHLVSLKDEVSEILATAEKRYSDDLERVVNLYGNMRAKEAATIVDMMDLASAVELVSAMPERQAGPILEKMDPQKAQAVSRVILDRNRLPADRRLPDLD